MSRSTVPNTLFGAYQPQYDHTQVGPAALLVLALGLIILPILGLNATNDTDRLGLLAVGFIVTSMAFSFRSLRIVDEGDVLALRYGPLPLFHKRFAYDVIIAAQRGRTAVIDGWGIHCVPWRGWTFNLWGFDCVHLTLANGRTARIGTDDPEGLRQFLQERCCLPTQSSANGKPQ